MTTDDNTSGNSLNGSWQALLPPIQIFPIGVPAVSATSGNRRGANTHGANEEIDS